MELDPAVYIWEQGIGRSSRMEVSYELDHVLVCLELGVCCQEMLRGTYIIHHIYHISFMKNCWSYVASLTFYNMNGY